jgi:predicted nucleic acid-binding protein
VTLRLFVDTNVLIYSRDEASVFHEIVSEALHGLVNGGVELCIHNQVLREYVAVATRPRPRGLGAGLEQVLNELKEFEGFYKVLPDPGGVWELWKQNIKDSGITGLQVHDAFLAAVMKGHKVDTILTLNVKDFESIDGIEVVLPQEWRSLMPDDNESE